MKDDKLDKILDHLYGELEPETEEDFLNEVSSSKLLSNRLTETRKLLTAYRLAPTMEIARDSAENALERLRTARATEAAALKSEEASTQLPEPETEPTEAHATGTMDSEQIAEPITPLPVDSPTRKKPSNLGLISTAAIIIIGVGVGYYLFNNTQPNSSQTLNNELELTFIESAASSLTTGKTIVEKKDLNIPSNLKATPTTIPELSPEALAANKAEENFEEIQDILEEIDEISLSRPTEELTVIDRSDSIELEDSDIDLLDISNIEPLPEMDSEAPDLETEFNQMLPEIEEPIPPLLPKHGDIDLAHDTQSSENTVYTPKTTAVELEKQKEAARLAEIEKQKEATRLAELEKQKETARLAEIEKQKEAARLAELEKQKEAARLAEIEKQKEATRLAEIAAKREVKIIEPITLSENKSIHAVNDLPVMPLSEDDNQPLAILIKPETTSNEKISFETADSIDQLIQKAEALYLKKSYLQALFGVEEALLQTVSRQDRISALTLKARIELQLKSFAEMQETISTLRPLSPLDASALQVLYNAALNHEKLAIQREQQAAHYYNTPESLNSTNNTEYQANTPQATPEDTSNMSKAARKKRFNPTTDTYYKRR